MVQKDWGPSFNVETLDTLVARTPPPSDSAPAPRPGPPQEQTGPPQDGRTGPPPDGLTGPPLDAPNPPQDALDPPQQWSGPPQDRRTGPPQEVGEEQVVVVHACPYNTLLRKYDALHLVAPIFCRCPAP